MDNKHNITRKNDWLKKLDEELTALGVKQGNFLEETSIVLIPKVSKNI